MGSESDTSACDSFLDNDGDLSDLDDVPLSIPHDYSDETDAQCDSDDAASLPSDGRPSSSHSRRLVPVLGMSKLALQTQPQLPLTEPMTERLNIRPRRMQLPTSFNHDMYTARPVPSEKETMSSCETQHITVELMSQAFVINRSLLSIKHPSYNGTALQQQIIERCSTSLGIAPEELKLHQVSSIDSTMNLEGCSHICVSINNSTFSLTALEEMLHNHKRLTARSDKLTTLNEDANNELRELRQQNESLLQRCHARESELIVANQRNLQLEQENITLRDKLRSATEARTEAYQSLQTLRQEFESLRASLQPAFPPPQHAGTPSVSSEDHEELEIHPAEVASRGEEEEEGQHEVESGSAAEDTAAEVEEEQAGEDANVDQAAAEGEGGPAQEGEAEENGGGEVEAIYAEAAHAEAIDVEAVDAGEQEGEGDVVLHLPHGEEQC